MCGLPNNCTNVELAIDKTDWVNHGKPKLKELFLQSITNHPILSKRFKNATLEQKIQGTSMELHKGAILFSGERYLKVGSFAQSINPITGHGLGHAMTMGMFAADQVAKCLEHNQYDAAFLKQYDKAVEKKLYPEIRAGKIITWVQLNHLNKMDKVIGTIQKNRILSKLFTKWIYH